MSVTQAPQEGCAQGTFLLYAKLNGSRIGDGRRESEINIKIEKGYLVK
jgi:hypothetical protein